MATKIGPKTVTQRDRSKNLVFCIDAAHGDSYGGQPFTQQIAALPSSATVGAATWTNGIDFGHGLVGGRWHQEGTGDVLVRSLVGASWTPTSGAVVTFSCYVWVDVYKSSYLKSQIYLNIGPTRNWLQHDGSWSTSIHEQYHLIRPTVQAQWTRLSTTITFPSGTLSGFSWGGYYRTSSNWNMCIANLQIESGSTATRYSSTSRSAKAPEILANGDFESWNSSTDLASWYESNAGGSSTHQDSAEEESGTYCVRLDVSASDGNVHIYTSVAPFVAGSRYRVTFSAKCSSGTLTASVYESEASYVPSPTGLGEDLALTTSYQRFTFEFTAAGADGLHGTSVGDNTNLLLGRKYGGGAASKSLYFDNASVVELGRGNDAVKDISGTVKRGLSLQGTYATYGQQLHKPFPLGGRSAGTLGAIKATERPRNVNVTVDPNKGHIGGAYWDLDGSDECIVVPYTDGSELDLSRGTIISWFKTSTGQNGAIVGWGTAGTNNYGNIAMTDNWTGAYADESLAFNRYSGSTAYIQKYIRNGANFYADGVWRCVAVTSHGGASDLGNIYIDGELMSVATTSNVGGAHPFMNLKSETQYLNIGRRPYSSGDAEFNGEIATCMIWAAALTAKEIKDIYIAQKGRFGK